MKDRFGSTANGRRYGRRAAAGERWRARRPGAVAGAALALALGAAPAAAQEAALTAECVEAGVDDDARRFCNLVAQAIEAAQPRIGLAASGGNPVPGTASTLGMRLGALPRISVAGRVTGVWADAPPIFDGGGELDFLLTSIDVDAAIGILEGFSPAPTVGGIASLDAIASAGLLSFPDDEFDDDGAFTWAIGARLGVLRESFTLPGISVTGLYRRVGGATFGDPELDETDGFFDTDGIRVLSLRGAASKRLFGFGLTLGAGYDHYRSDVSFGFVNPGATGPSEVRLQVDDFENDRFVAFGNVSWTLLILSAVAELGWQSGTDDIGATLPIGTDDAAEGGAWFGSLALRVAI